MITAELYEASRSEEWDDLIDRSRNATFLLKRPYMDYHSDRFADCSLMLREIRGARSRILTALPASAHGDKVVSHGGLTYGGFIMPQNGLDGCKLLDVMSVVKAYYRDMGFTSLRYKAIPYIYHRYPSDEDIYALFRQSAVLVETNLSSAIDLSLPYGFDENSRRNRSKAIRGGLTVDTEASLTEFWPILERVLAERHEARPVHTFKEIELLHSRFPDQIRLVIVRDGGGTAIAGTLLYDTGPCVHAQYIASLSQGRQIGALPFLFSYVIDHLCSNARYLDFGTSNEDHGHVLNSGLLMSKNGYGGRGIAYNIYEIKL